MGSSFNFTAETFPDSPFLRTELLDLEQDCAVVQKQSTKLAKGISAYLTAIDVFRDAESALIDLLRVVASEGTGTGNGAALDSLKHYTTLLCIHTESLGHLRKAVATTVAQKLTPLAQGANLKDYREAAAAAVISATAYESARRADAGQRRRAARIVLEEARFAQLSTALRVDRESQLQLSDLLLEITLAHNVQALSMLEVTHEGALAVGDIQSLNQRSRNRLQQEQSELSEAFSSYCRFLEGGTSGESKSHRAALGPDTSSRRYKEIASVMLLTMGGNPVVIKQGYLLKRYTTLGRDSWKKRFFVIDSKGDFYYLSNSDRPLPRSSTLAVSEPVLRQNSRGASETEEGRKDAAGLPSVGGRSVNLLTAMLRPGIEGMDVAFAFTLMSIDTTYHLQAEGEAERDDWIEVASIVTSELLNNGGASAGGNPKHTPVRSSGASGSFASDSLDSAPSDAEGASVLETLWALGGCNLCADCSAPSPDWASLNLGIVFCLQCSGVHRQLGVSISKVRSCVLDVSAWTPAAIELFRCVGNDRANSIWEAHLSDGSSAGAKKPAPDDPLDLKVAFIREKYGARRFLRSPPAGETEASAAADLEDSVHRGDSVAALRVLLSPINDPSSASWVSTAGSVLCTAAAEPERLGMLELLLHFLPRSCIKAHDAAGLTPLHHAAKASNTDGVVALLLRGADAAERDQVGRTALQLIQRQDSSSSSAGDAPSTPKTPCSSRTVVDIVGMLAAAEATSRDASDGLLSP